MSHDLSQMMIKEAIAKLADRVSLSEKESEEVMAQIMDGAATSPQIAAYLMGLRMKGETVEEIAGLGAGHESARDQDQGRRCHGCRYVRDRR